MRRGKQAFCVTLALVLSFAMTGASAKTLIPGGQSIGVVVRSEGLVVIGVSDVGKTPSPARLAGIRSGDVLTRLNGEELTDVEQLTGLLDDSPCEVTYLRKGETRTAKLTPARDKDGSYRIGAWVRKSAAGIGTLTFYDPETGRYGALGHPVTDADAGVVLPVEGGSIYENTVVGVEKGTEGRPGELLGEFFEGTELGSVEKNGECGIFGHAPGALESDLFPQGVEAAARKEIHTGRAQILSTVNGEGTRNYECEITRIDEGASPVKALTLKITDEALLKTTGGIVQGMSGSPILQDGKLVGAVTHVLVNDPTRGYGIPVGDMLEAAG